MEVRLYPILILCIVHLRSSTCDQRSPNEEGPKRQENEAERDYCKNPETPSQQRLLEVIDQCTKESPDCLTLSDCLSDKLVKISEETMIACKKAAAEGEKTSSFRPCSVAATAYVILEQIRLLLIEDTVYRNCSQVKHLFEHAIRQCGGEEGVKYLEKTERSTQDDITVQEILAKFLVGIGKKMQTYEAVRKDIAELERSKHMKALGAMCVSFALPGLLGLCEAAHFRTGLILQILALFVIGIYQFSRYGGYWAFVGVGSCLLIMAVEMGLMILIKKKLIGEAQEEKKTE